MGPECLWDAPSVALLTQSLGAVPSASSTTASRLCWVSLSPAGMATAL